MTTTMDWMETHEMYLLPLGYTKAQIKAFVMADYCGCVVPEIETYPSLVTARAESRAAATQRWNRLRGGIGQCRR
jgi:hypothetical protein